MWTGLLIQGGSPQEHRWMFQLGRLIFAVERARKLQTVLLNSSMQRQHLNAPDHTEAPEIDNSFPPGKQSSDLLLGQQGCPAEESAWMQQVQPFNLRDSEMFSSVYSYWQ